MSKKEIAPEVELEKAYERWNEIYQNGTYDPLWADGMNLNLVRNHIIYYRKQIEEQYKDTEKPSIYDREVPAKVDYDYMARKEEILENALQLQERLEALEEAKELVKAENYINSSMKEYPRIQCQINRIKGLQSAIHELDYVEMRSLSRDIEREVLDIKEAYESLENREHQDIEQISLFEMKF